jgi:hypothetical protein
MKAPRLKNSRHLWNAGWFLGGRAGLVLLAAPSAAFAAPSVAREWNEELMAAIRLNVPNPPAHARNLFHTAAATYNAWAAYAPRAAGYLYNEKAAVIPAAPGEVELARRESISYAAYRILRSRFASGQGSSVILPAVDARLTALGYSTATGQAAATAAATPAELGKRIGDAVLAWGAGDGFALTAYPQFYNSGVNPNVQVPLGVLGTNTNGTANMPLGYGCPAATNPNFWQPLSLSVMVDQNGFPQPGGTQTFVGAQGLAATPFSLTRTDPLKPWLDPCGGPSRLSTLETPSATDAAYKEQALGVIRASSQLNDPTIVDISPGSFGNNPLGADSGTGHPVNPVTGLAYAANPVKRSDYVRVLAEFWADGPNSETPPGHWHVLANEIGEMPQLQKRIRGTGPVVNDLEWDVKTYFALAGATHDAACAAWSLKRYYNGPRPITMIRYMGTKGQSSDPAGPSYHPQGLPLEPGVAEVVTEASAAPGQRHQRIWDVASHGYINGSLLTGYVVVYSWPGEHPDNLPAPSVATHQSLVRWQLAQDWLPFQRKTFNTPAFPGYVSGHSSFSRAAAEALTLLTGSSAFPGGFHHHTIAANSLQIDLGPSAPVDLQWATYYDAADQAGQSRRWGGIHPSEDDFHGRVIGSMAGKAAFALAEQYWTGAILTDSIQPALTFLNGGSVKLTWNPVRGMYHKVQTSLADLGSWANATTPVLARGNGAIAGDPAGEWIDPNPVVGRKFYRIVRTYQP